MLASTILQALSQRTGVPVHKKEIHAGSLRTAYLDAGAGFPALLIHGAGASAKAWYPVIGPLAARFRVIAPDVVGYGESDRPSAPYDRPYFSGWLAGFAEALGLESFHLVGHSQGGAIAIQFALDHPARVSRLVLVDAAGLGRGVAGIPRGLKLNMIWVNLLPSRAASRRLLQRYMVSDPSRADEILDEMGKVGRQNVRMPGSWRVTWQGHSRVVETVPAADLARIAHETLIIWGEDDRCLPVADIQPALAALPNARLHVIPHTGHMVYFEDPAAFNEVLLRFLVEGRA